MEAAPLIPAAEAQVVPLKQAYEAPSPVGASPGSGLELSSWGSRFWPKSGTPTLLGKYRSVWPQGRHKQSSPSLASIPPYKPLQSTDKNQSLWVLKESKALLNQTINCSFLKLGWFN